MNKTKVILADFQVDDDWELKKGLEEQTGKKWKVLWWKNTRIENNIFLKLKRLCEYFIHPFGVFIHRKQYESIVAWQQFYGLIFAFYCNLFKVKKTSELIVLTFIYKKKKGFIGKIYHSFISSVVHSKYVDKFVVFSETEVEYYSKLFEVSKERFQFFPLGIEVKDVEATSPLPVKKPFLLSAGRTNRDYGFLFSCADELPYSIVVLTDMLKKDLEVPKNVTLLDNVWGDEYLKYLSECSAILISLENPHLSAGQLSMLQAMHYKKPIIITESYTVDSYVKHEVNALVCKKEKKAFNEAVCRIMTDSELYQRLSENGYRIVNEKFSVRTLGKNIGTILK